MARTVTEGIHQPCGNKTSLHCPYYLPVRPQHNETIFMKRPWTCSSKFLVNLVLLTRVDSPLNPL